MVYKGLKGQDEKIKKNNFFNFFKSFLGVARPPPGVPGPKNRYETLEKQAQTGRIQKGVPGPPPPLPHTAGRLKKHKKTASYLIVHMIILEAWESRCGSLEIWLGKHENSGLGRLQNCSG